MMLVRVIWMELLEAYNFKKEKRSTMAAKMVKITIKTQTPNLAA